MSSMSTDQTLMHLAENIRAAVGVATRRGYDLPPEHTAAQAIADAAAALRVEQAPPMPELPAKAKDVAAWVTARAEALVRHEKQATVAAELADRAERNAMHAMMESLPTYLGNVCDEFNAHLEDFRRLLNVAPRTVSGHMTGEQFEQHAELLRTTEAMTIAAIDRAALALVTDEQQDIGGNAMWLVLEPKPTTTIATVREVLNEFSSRFPQDIEEWARVDSLGCSIARGGQAAARVAAFKAIVFAGANGPDGGLLDKSYAEARAMAGDNVIPGAFRGDPFAIEQHKAVVA